MGIDCYSGYHECDPQNSTGAITQSLQSMMMLVSIDTLTSPGGVNSIVGGGLGGLQSLASTFGVQQVLSALSTATSTGATTTPQSTKTILNTGITGLLTNSPVGALSVSQVNLAESTQAALQALATSNTPEMSRLLFSQLLYLVALLLVYLLLLWLLRFAHSGSWINH